MWGVVQGAVSTLDFDYVEYAASHFARLEGAPPIPATPPGSRDARAG